MSAENNSGDVSKHIVPTAATMVGVCMTVISIVRLMELTGRMSTIIDDLLVVESVVFLTSCMLSYVSLRSQTNSVRLERYADLLFLAGLSGMVLVSCMLAFEIGQVGVQPHLHSG
jgi:hypothetical protein